MRLSTFLCFGLLVLALAPQRADAWAATCADNLLESGCYQNSTACRWNYTTSVCQNGAPTVSTCVEFYRDTTGCTAASGCAVNPNNNFCFKAPVACTAIVDDYTMCTYRGDCKPDTDPTACVVGDSATRPAVYATDPVGCKDAGYLYVPFSPQTSAGCFYNQTTFEAIYGTTCFAYSHYPALTAAAACSQISGCEYSLATDTCITAVATPLPPAAASTRNLGDTGRSFSYGLRVGIIAVAAFAGVLFLAYLYVHFFGSKDKSGVGKKGSTRPKKPAVSRSNSVSGRGRSASDKGRKSGDHYPIEVDRSRY